MNLLGSSEGGGATCEVESALCLFAGINFRGAIGVDLGLGFSADKEMREREEGQPRILFGGKMKS